MRGSREWRAPVCRTTAGENSRRRVGPRGRRDALERTGAAAPFLEIAVRDEDLLRRPFSPARDPRRPPAGQDPCRDRGRNNTASTMLNTAAVAPTPSASVRAATAVSPRFFRSMRPANRRSLSIDPSINDIDSGRRNRRVSPWASPAIHVRKRPVSADGFGLPSKTALWKPVELDRKICRSARLGVMPALTGVLHRCRTTGIFLPAGLPARSPRRSRTSSTTGARRHA